jgi:hypothetical protein
MISCAVAFGSFVEIDTDNVCAFFDQTVRGGFPDAGARANYHNDLPVQLFLGRHASQRSSNGQYSMSNASCWSIASYWSMASAPRMTSMAQL